MNFNNPYSREAYKEFFQNQYLTDDFKISEEKLSFEFTPQYLKSAFVIGEDKSLELKVLEVLHDSENDPTAENPTVACTVANCLQISDAVLQGNNQRLSAQEGCHLRCRLPGVEGFDT